MKWKFRHIYFNIEDVYNNKIITIIINNIIKHIIFIKAHTQLDHFKS
jgi:hypothetical protein